MTRSKKDKIGTDLEDEIFMQRIKNVIWTSTSFRFSDEESLAYINSGLLGKDDNGKPVTIGRTTYYRYKKALGEIPQIYEDLKNFAMSGYTKMIVGYQEELATLHRMSIENLMTPKLNPMAKQAIIDSIISKVIPTEAAFADMTKKLIESNRIIQEKALEHTRINPA